MTDPYQEVAVVLPYSDGKILLQLRDFNPSIAFPGHWGYFGGSIGTNEKPIEAAFREIIEELCYTPIELYFLEKNLLPEHNNLISYLYCFKLDAPIEALIQTEGLDLKLASHEEVLTKNVYSNKLNKSFPIIHHPYFLDMFQQCLTFMAGNSH